MADASKLNPFILKWEGGFVNDKFDRGGATNAGITIATFRQYYPKATIDDLRKMTDSQWLNIFKRGYWTPWQADKITNQSIANLCVDFGWASGPVNAIKRVQRCLGLTPDGEAGPKTLAVLNGQNKESVFKNKAMPTCLH